MTSGTKNLVFVYGTLKMLQPNHYWLTNTINGDAHFICNGMTCDRFPLVIATRYHVPFLLKQSNIGYQINGEIYEIDELMLTKLDELENHPIYYLREQISIRGENGLEYLCWVYFLKSYPGDFLNERKLLKSYEDSDTSPYIPPKDRPTSPKLIDDLGYRSS